MNKTAPVIVAVALVLLVGQPLSAGPDWTTIATKAVQSVVYVEGDGGCTGFVIDAARKYVLTAAHCDVDEPTHRLWVDRVEGHVLVKDTKKDLMVVKVDDLDPSRPALALADADPSIQQDVLSIGYGYALERPFFRRAAVADTSVYINESGVGGPFIGIDAAFVPGQSGGPILNANGAVVGIVQRATDRLGIGVGAMLIRERIGRFWATEKK